MRKAVKYMVLTICILIYIVSCNSDLTTKFYYFKASIPVLKSERWRYGDLYGMSYLSYFRKHSQDSSVSYKRDCRRSKRGINLYAICDSYIWNFFPTKDFFCNVNNLFLVKTNNEEQLKVILDTSKINVLLVEFSERNVRNIVGYTSYINNLISIEALEAGIKKAAIDNKTTKINSNIYPKPFLQKIKSDVQGFLFNRDINSNIEANIWDVSLFTPIKEFKADINYRLFGSLPQDVKISENKRQLFYSPTIDTSNSMSSFKSIPDEERDTLIDRLNRIYYKAKRSGFTKVYLSIVPNPVSIISPGYKGLTYNHLIEQIEYSKKLDMPCIDIMAEFKKTPDKVYSKSDTHWNFIGAHMWLDKFNAELNQVVLQDEGSR
jgi:hypothetical protein